MKATCANCEYSEQIDNVASSLVCTKNTAEIYIDHGYGIEIMTSVAPDNVCEKWEGSHESLTILQPWARLMSKIWVCAQCGTRIESRMLKPVPKACQCGCLGWVAVNKA
jgi:hypothetical protein